MNSLGPAIVAGSVGLIAALLSFAIAVLSLRQVRQDSRETRAQTESLALIPRRLTAIETLWLELYEIERGQTVDESVIRRIIPAIMWLPPTIRDQFTKLLLDRLHHDNNFEINNQEFLILRQGLLDAAHVASIDRSFLLQHEEKTR